jgi:hypothetical protein
MPIDADARRISDRHGRGRPIFGSSHAHHGMTMCAARRPLFGRSGHQPTTGSHFPIRPHLWYLLLDCLGRKILSMTSAPVVITGRGSRR